MTISVDFARFGMFVQGALTRHFWPIIKSGGALDPIFGKYFLETSSIMKKTLQGSF